MVNALFQLDDKEFENLRTLTYSSIGVNLTQAKKPLIISRLSKRLRQLDFDSFQQYIDFLEETPEEMEVMANLLTTNVTKFFREIHHFNYLQEEVLPKIVEKAEAGHRPFKVRAWSAGCSTGEEPYTIAIVLHNFFHKHKEWDFKVLASDVNSQVLKEASDGIYHKDRVKGISYDFLKRYFALGQGVNQGLFRVKDFLKEKVAFRRINLIREEEYPKGQELDFIFCRNVFIYFDRESQENIISMYSRRVRQGGFLFLGHSETISVRSPVARQWKLVKHTVYQKV